ncbi:hypothetical protein ACLBXJ_26930 [Methylobacterium mesophilicum]
METEPRPVEIRDAFVGAVLIVLGAYVGGGAIWSWVFWPDQHIDASRLFALLFAWVAIMGGWTLIEKWLGGEWFEGRKRRWKNSSSNQQDQSGSPSDSGATCDPGSGDGGSCST